MADFLQELDIKLKEVAGVREELEKKEVETEEKKELD